MLNTNEHLHFTVKMQLALFTMLKYVLGHENIVYRPVVYEKELNCIIYDIRISISFVSLSLI